MRISVVFVSVIFCCCKSQEICSDLKKGNLQGNVSAVKTLFMKSNSFELKKYDKVGRLILEGYGYLDKNDSVANCETRQYLDTITKISTYENGRLTYEKELHFLKTKRTILEIDFSAEKADTLYYYGSDKLGNVTMVGGYHSRHIYESFRDYNNIGLIKSVGNFEEPFVSDITMKKPKENLFITYQYNYKGCLIKEKLLQQNGEIILTHYLNDKNCNRTEVLVENITQKKTLKKWSYKNELDKNNNWVKRYVTNNNGDTISYEVREIEYYK